MVPTSDGSQWWAAVDYFIPRGMRSQVTRFSRARVLVVISLCGTLVSLAVQGLRLPMAPQHWVPLLSWIVCTAMLAATPWVLKYAGSLPLAGTCAALAVVIGAVGVAAFEGGLASPNAMVLIAVVLPAIALGDRMAGRVMALAGLLGTLLLFLASMHGVMPVETPLDRASLNVMRFAIQAAMIIVLAILTGLYERERQTNERRLEDKARELTSARDEALRAARVKSEFLANMSHEIRTPLNGVIGMTELMLHSSLHQRDRRSLLTIRNSGQALLTVINDVLDLSKLDAEQLVLEQEPFSLGDCVEEVLTLFGHEALRKGVELNLRQSASAPRWVRGDVARLRQVLINLVGNAVKFTERGSITVEIETDARGCIHLSVHDSGIGIAQDDCVRLFEPFAQADASTTRKYGGTGLGLAISRRLVALMGGKLWVESELGTGSVFHVTLRLPHERNSDAEVPAALHGRQVLFVESHPVTATVGVELLEAAGCVVHLANDVATAEAALRSAPALDAVVVSSALPDLSILEQLLDQLAKDAPRLFLRTPSEAEDDNLSSAGRYAADVLKPLRRGALWDGLLSCLSQPERLDSQTPNLFDASFASRYPLRILVAEDNPINQMVILTMLKRLGYEPELACNGGEVVVALERAHFDLVLLDMHMPVMDGLALAHRIHDKPPRGHVPALVAVTASVLPEQCAQYREAGIMQLIAKPVQVHVLRKVLERAVGVPDCTAA